MEVKEFRKKLHLAKRILQTAKSDYKEARNNLSNELLEPYNIHVGSDVIYNHKRYRVSSALLNSENLIYVTIVPIEFEYFEGEDREHVLIDALI